jgi:hypothetical protein
MRKLICWVVAVSAVCGLFSLSPLILPPGFMGQDKAIIPTARAAEEADGGSINSLKVEALHKATRISWRVGEDVKGPMTFEIYRSMSSPDGQYTLVTSMPWEEGVAKYKYVDKDLPVEENYFYKVEIPETKESFGPFQVRPPFTLPST